MAGESGIRPSRTKNLVGIGITLLCLAIIVRQIDVQEVFRAINRFKWPYLVLGTLSLCAGYCFRIARWSVMLKRIASAPSASFSNCTAPFLGSIALNNIFPLRLGDIVRMLVFPKAMGISKTVASGSLMMERLIDLVTLVICFAVSAAIIDLSGVSHTLTDSVVVIASLGGGALLLIFLFSGWLAQYFAALATSGVHFTGRGRASTAFMTMANLLHSFEAMSRPRVLLLVIAISMFVWMGESGLFYFVLQGFGLDAKPAIAVLVMAIATLSTLVPSSPGYIGPFHLAAFTAVSLVGGTSAQAAGYAVLSHLALWIPTTVAGAIAIWMRPALFKAVKPA